MFKSATSLRSTGVLPRFLPIAGDEAMLSWLLRLATRLRVSVHAVARQSFGIDDSRGLSQWWCRPDRETAVRISERTGLSVPQVLAMTQQHWSPVYRDDEANIRFSGRRFARNPFGRRLPRLVLCGECLKSDAEPYLRLPWMLGWFAVCPYHQLILIARCPTCRTRVSHTPFRSTKAFTPHICRSCGANLLDSIDYEAHGDVMRLQAAMFAAKCNGFTEFPGIGRLNWQEVVALADVILGTFWNEPGIEERLEILKRVNHVFQLDGLPEGSCYDSRYGSLALLAWFLRRWPDGAGSAVAIDLLERWSRAKRNRVSRHLGVPDWNHAWNPGANEIEPAIQARLRELLESAREG
jgi:hypothetical protein